jgi:hypothetical protein
VLEQFHTKEESKMKYSKPEVNVIGPAVNIVQGGKASGSPHDNMPLFKTTIGAYEADE